MKSVLFFLFALAVIPLHSQVCTGDFLFATQSELDAFLANNPTCTMIDGSVTVGNGPSIITNTDGLQNITEITGDVIINGNGTTDAMSLAGLASLTTIGNLYMYGADAPSGNFTDQEAFLNLVSANGLQFYSTHDINYNNFDNVTTCNGIIVLYSWDTAYTNLFPNLVSTGEIIFSNLAYPGVQFSGFNNLISASTIQFGYAGEGLTLSKCDAFHSLQTLIGPFIMDFCTIDTLVGFENLESVEYIFGDLQTETDWPDFNSLSEVGSIMCYGGTNLESIDAPDFPMLTDVGSLALYNKFDHLGAISLEHAGSLEVSSNGDYVVTGLNSITVIDNNLTISYLPSNDLNFLSTLESVGGNISITECEFLSSCAIQGLCDRLNSNPVGVTFENNGPGCNSVAEVASGCAISSLTGIVYADLDCDEIFNNADILVPNITVINQDNLPVDVSNGYGEFSTSLPDNNTTTLHINPLPGFNSTNISHTITNEDIAYTENFALCPPSLIHNLSLDIIGGGIRPGIIYTFTFNIENHGTQAEYFTLTADISGLPGITLINAYGGTISGNTVTWSVLSLELFALEEIRLTVLVSQSTALGTPFTISANVEGSALDDVPADNYDELTQVAVNSYDPNDKTVDKALVEYVDVQDGEALSLEYLIRFQNTGTAEAINIRVSDDIESDLDLSTFEMMASSHSFQVSFGENGRVEWLFENINLPDSNSNEEASHGYIKFRIRSKQNLVLSDVIENTVAIYFDFNVPVITNTATTIFYTCPDAVYTNGDMPGCSGDDLELLASDGWDDYAWTMNGSAVSEEASLVLDDMTAGDYSLDLSVSTAYCTDDYTSIFSVLETPSIPVITQTGNVLSVTGMGEYAWTMNGQPFASDVSFIEIMETGTYGVTAWNGNCFSETVSGSFTYTGLQDNAGDMTFTIYPNPMREISVISLSNAAGNPQLEMVDARGKTVMSRKMVGDKLTLKQGELAAGIYMIILRNETNHQGNTLRLIVE